MRIYLSFRRENEDEQRQQRTGRGRRRRRPERAGTDGPPAAADPPGPAGPGRQPPDGRAVRRAAGGFSGRR